MSFLKNIRSISSNFREVKKNLDHLKVLAGRQLSLSMPEDVSMKNAEFKVFSQWGDDGIIQYLIRKINISNPYFVEFGVENYTEANTRFLLINNNWSGLVMDGSANHINYIKQDDIYWKYELQAKQAFVTAENINDLLKSEQVPEKIGILHIDIDGNDYWIWKKIESVIADIVIVEYNSLFGAERSITIPYKSDFARTKAHYTNLYFGSSLLSLCDLATEKGYSFIGCNSSGNNAYFVLNEKINNLTVLSASEGFVNSKFKEARNESGALTYLIGKARAEKIKGLEVFNTRTGKLEPF